MLATVTNIYFSNKQHSVSFKLLVMHFCPTRFAYPRSCTVPTLPRRTCTIQSSAGDEGDCGYMYKTSVEILESKKRALEEGDEATERQVAGEGYFEYSL
jgi:hypothetical protein